LSYNTGLVIDNYHIKQENGVEKAIAGSSNFTVNGLGLGGSNNIELNLIIDSDRDRQELKQWFDSIWNDATGLVEDVKAEVLKYLELLYVENEPEFIYFKTLYHIFEGYLNEQKEGGLLDEKTGFYDSEVWKMLYDFQKDGVKGAINKIWLCSDNVWKYNPNTLLSQDFEYIPIV